MNPTSADRHLGEYRLIELIAETSRSRTWLAEQVSVARRVLVEELQSEQSHQSAAFIADVRAKATVEHPLIASVYEAVDEPDHCFFAREFLPGATLEDRRQAGEPFKPGRLAHLLRRIAEAHIQHESMGQATDPLGLEHVHLDEHGVIRLDNLAIAGRGTPEDSARDIHHLGRVMPSLVADGQAGSTRMLTLLGWMRGEGIEERVDWGQVASICGQIEQQLADPPPPASPTKSAAQPRKKKKGSLMAILCGLVLLGLLALVLRPRPKAAPASAHEVLPDAIHIPAGKYPTPDGTEEELQSFQICPHEVTIRQYADFIEILETLAKDRRERTFDHENQPAEKTSHLPDDWPALLAAAKSKGTWNARAVTLDSPVVGVDWWDASAYTEWKQVRLATQEEWFAALSKDVPAPLAIPPSAWLPVTAETTDHTPLGLLGMAGSVCEWTRRPAVNPTNPLGARKWVIIGGSFLKPGSNALTREWTEDRGLRRPDLGFRVVFDTP